MAEKEHLGNIRGKVARSTRVLSFWIEAI
jgi:hypothetical protein